MRSALLRIVGESALILSAGLLLLSTAGCAHDEPVTEVACCEPLPVQNSASFRIDVPGNQQWVQTGYVVQQGTALSIFATGGVTVPPQADAHAGLTIKKPPPGLTVGPNGTFLYDDNVADKTFPLPSAAAGPASVYCLMGRIGDGEPFYVGERCSWIAKNSGQLLLGVNDFDPADNQGSFQVQIEQPENVQPLNYETIIPLGAPTGQPVENAAVVVFYIDGLRPDVLREMAYMGHVPTLNKLFVSGGVWASNVFTGFPSDTITSNGTMWTGCFSDRHGIKGQVRFSRRTLHSESYLEPLGPNRSARLLAPQGIDKALHQTATATVGLIGGKTAATEYDLRRRTGVKPVFQHLRDQGKDWSTGVLPMMTDVPPLLWTRSMVRQMPYLQSQNGWQYIDDANIHYAKRHLIPKRSPITIIWLPETDSVSHKFNRGQFGVTRRTIAKADLLVKQVVDELEATGQLRNTYLMLVSDHGHHGGRDTHLSHFDLANQFFHQQREVTADGRWVGGGMGMSVRQHRFWNRHKGDASTEFVFLDGDSDGVARVFLPRKHFRSHQWGGVAQPADMLAYQIDDHREPVNLVKSLTAIQAVHGNGQQESPIDLVLMKLTENSILITTAQRGEAVIDRERNAAGEWTYRYRVVTNVQPTVNGTVTYEEIAYPKVDPLRLLEQHPSRLLEYRHTEQAWLRITAMTTYPDSVVALTRHMLWQENLKYREEEFAPDIVVTANPGWYFGQKGSRGTMHGYPFADTMRATLFISGPNIRRGARMDIPCRLADLTPTMLQMTGIPTQPSEFDGKALEVIYETASQTENRQAVFWQDVDLQAWQQLSYIKLEPYKQLPITINKPYKPYDLNNIVYNTLTISELNVLRLFDDVVSPLTLDSMPKVAPLVDQADANLRHSQHNWLGEAVDTIDLPGVSVGDYSVTSLGNLKRADRAIDWVQNRGSEADHAIAKRVNREQLPCGKHIDATIDTAQSVIWEVYRFGQRVIVELLDETLLNSIENSTDRTINSLRKQPAEVEVQAPTKVNAEVNAEGRARTAE